MCTKWMTWWHKTPWWLETILWLQQPPLGWNRPAVVFNMKERLMFYADRQQAVLLRIVSEVSSKNTKRGVLNAGNYLFCTYHNLILFALSTVAWSVMIDLCYPCQRLRLSRQTKKTAGNSNSSYRLFPLLDSHSSCIPSLATAQK